MTIDLQNRDPRMRSGAGTALSSLAYFLYPSQVLANTLTFKQFIERRLA